MLQLSFRWVANRFVPQPNPRKRALFGLALLLAAGCGGGGSSRPEHVLRGTGYSFSAPTGWAVTRSGREVQVAKGIALVSVTRYPLLRAYRSSLWEHVVPELDHAAAGLAAQQTGTVGESRTVTISGRRARRYDIDYTRNGKQLVERLTFVLRGKTEYLLLCRYDRGGDTRACDRLLATFTLG
jgi:hypothetical protein